MVTCKTSRGDPVFITDRFSRIFPLLACLLVALWSVLHLLGVDGYVVHEKGKLWGAP